MKTDMGINYRHFHLLGLISATCGILLVSQLSARADSNNNWSVNRVAKDVTSIVAAGVGASMSGAAYLPATIAFGPTLASGVAGSAGFAAGGATKIAGDYLVNNPKSSVRTASATVIGGDITSFPANIKILAESLVRKISNRLFK